MTILLHEQHEIEHSHQRNPAKCTRGKGKKMQKSFFVRCESSGRSYCLDISLFTSLNQLTKTLADIFAFADTQCGFPLLLSLSSVLIRNSFVAC